MLGVTVVAVVLALARAFPVFVVQFVTVNLLPAAPALSVLSVATWLSNNRRRTLIVIGGAIFVGWLISPYIYVYWSRPPTFWDRFWVDFYSIGMFMFGGAIIGAILDMMIRFAMPKTKREHAG